jgi:hypothetical protein
MNSLIGDANASVTRFGPSIIRHQSMRGILCSRLFFFASLRLRVRFSDFLRPAAFERSHASGGSPFAMREIPVADILGAEVDQQSQPAICQA